MTRFPTMRKLIRVTSVAVPCMLLGAYLLMASEHPIWAAVVVVTAFTLFLAFPSFITDQRPAQNQSSSETEGPASWVRRFAKYCLFLWFINQPEVEAFQKRLLHDGGLWDMKLVVPLVVLTCYYIYAAQKRVSAITDTAIYNYFTQGSLGVLKFE